VVGVVPVVAGRDVAIDAVPVVRAEVVGDRLLDDQAAIVLRGERDLLCGDVFGDGRASVPGRGEHEYAGGRDHDREEEEQRDQSSSTHTEH
jgi:hypothetical protein